MLLDDLLDARDDGGDLVAGRTRERQLVGHQLVEPGTVQWDAGVRGELVEQLVALGALLAHGEGRRDGVLLDGLVGLLAADARPHRRHQDLRRGEERQVAVQLAGDDGRERAELVEHRQERLQKTVEREERVRQRDAAHHGAGDVALVPLVARQLPGHRRVAAQDDHEAVDALAGAGVHLVRHRGRADLARLEALGDELVPGHQTDRLGGRGRRGRELYERGDDLVVEGARVDLADRGERLREAQVARDALLQLVELRRVAAEQVQHVLRGADGALDAAQRVAGEQLLDPGVRDEQLVGGGREALAEGRGLRRDVVRAARDHQLAVLIGQLAEAREDGDGAVADQLEGEADLELLDVLREVAGRHALVDLLVAA